MSSGQRGGKSHEAEKGSCSRMRLTGHRPPCSEVSSSQAHSASERRCCTLREKTRDRLLHSSLLSTREVKSASPVWMASGLWHSRALIPVHVHANAHAHAYTHTRGVADVKRAGAKAQRADCLGPRRVLLHGAPVRFWSWLLPLPLPCSGCPG